MWTKCGQNRVFGLFVARYLGSHNFAENPAALVPSGFHSFRHSHGHGHGRADHRIVAHALFDFLCLSTFYQIFPVSLVPQSFSHMVAFCPFPLFATFFCAFLKKCGQNVDKNCYSI
jgi:hypothetical protein